MAKLPQEPESNKIPETVSRSVVFLTFRGIKPADLAADISPHDLEKAIERALEKELGTFPPNSALHIEVVDTEYAENDRLWFPQPEDLAPKHPMPPLPYNYTHGRD